LNVGGPVENKLELLLLLLAREAGRVLRKQRFNSSRHEKKEQALLASVRAGGQEKAAAWSGRSVHTSMMTGIQARRRLE
jgi:hypothetical protein